MALAGGVTLPHFDAAPASAARAQLWIASDTAPVRAQQWPVLVPIPDGWHEVSPSEAATILESPRSAVTFNLGGGGSSEAAEVAALTSSSPSEARRRASRPPRAPRPPRPPRSPRPPRVARIGRLDRGPRPPRAPRLPRPPRKARKPRPARFARPARYKTVERPGVCKGPGCTCWTPAGCIGAWYLDALPDFAKSDCYRGPCYDYGACVTERCQVHPACLVNTILQFWVNQYRAVAANPLGYPAQVAASVAQAARQTLAVGKQVLAQFELIAPVIEGVTEGCPPGTRWAVGLTGYSCQSPATHPIAATREQLIAAGILRA